MIFRTNPFAWRWTPASFRWSWGETSFHWFSWVVIWKTRFRKHNAEAGQTDEGDSVMGMVVPYRGSRCGMCYWALYDGHSCQNMDCVMSGKNVGENRVQLTNEEAQILIRHNATPGGIDEGDSAEGIVETFQGDD